MSIVWWEKIDKKMYDYRCVVSFEEIDPERTISLLSFLFKYEHCLHFYVCILQLVLRSNDVRQLVLVHYYTQLLRCVRVTVDRQQAVHVGYHQIAMDELKHVDDVLGLILRGLHLHQRTNSKIG